MLDYQENRKKSRHRSIDDAWEENPPPDPLSEDDFLKLFDNCGTVAAWDFNATLGNTIKEKYDSLSYKILEVAGAVAMRLNRPMLFWAAVPWFIGNCMSLQDTPRIFPMGGKEPIYLGVLMQKVEIYACPLLDNRILVGCGKEVLSNDHYARINLHNFIV